jgi:hypothetical protein
MPMDTTSRFRCPACDFAIFNRRISNCESCGEALPKDLLYSPEDLLVIEQEHAKNEKIRLVLEKAEKRMKDSVQRLKDRMSD